RFSDFFPTSCGLSFSGHGYPTQCAANTCCPRSDRFWLRELRVSQHFSTFYEPYVQAMDTRLGAASTADPDDPPRSRSTNNARNRPRLEGEACAPRSEAPSRRAEERSAALLALPDDGLDAGMGTTC